MHTQKRKGTKKISEELIYKVCSYIRVGVPVESAAIASGIEKSDYLLWTREGKSPHHYEGCKDCDFALFFRQITIARAQTIALFFASITRAAANGDWKASVWWLERYGELDDQEDSKPSHPITNEELFELIDEVERGRNPKNN